MVLPKNRNWRFCTVLLLTIISLSFAQKEKYLIIVESQYAQDPNLSEFIDFREQDYEVTVKTLSDVGNSESGIKSAMQNMYDNGGLKYTLLIGRSNGGIPYKKAVGSSGVNSYNTFHDYGLMDNDAKLDVAVGCFFVSNSTDLANIIRKTMHTENNIGSYPKITTQFSSYISRAHIYEQCEAIKDEYWDQSDYEVSWMVPLKGSGTNNQYVETLRSQINNNETSIVAYQAHGAEDGWVSGGAYYSAAESRQGLAFDVDDVKNLTNDEVYPIVMSFACVTGSFQLSGGFGETWLKSDGGACAFIGSSKNSSHYQKTLNASIASAFCHEEIGTLGDLFLSGKNFLRDSTRHFEDIMTTSSSGGVSVVIADEQMYNLFGDPALRIKPKTVANSHNNLLSGNSIGIKVKSITSQKLILSIKEAGNYTISLLSLKGETISKISNNKYLSVGENSVSLDKVVPANGIYLLNIIGNDTKFTSKVSILK